MKRIAPLGALALVLFTLSCGSDKTPSTNDSGATPTADKGSTPTADKGTSPADLGKPTGCSGICPYTTNSFDCTAACNNIYDWVVACGSSAQGVPPEFQKILDAMLGINPVTAKAACKGLCIAQSVAWPCWWGCMQSAPATDCTGFAGCYLTTGGCFYN
jgi:hypothetical protein